MDEQPVADQIEFIAGLPTNFSVNERARFQEIVIHAGEVTGAALTANIASARILVVLIHQGIVRGVAALKRPQATYRNKIAKRVGFALTESNFPYELGYVFIEPNLRGLGLSNLLVSEALAHDDGASVFATVRIDNGAMRAVLCGAGFAAMGIPYRGQRGQMIGLLLRERREPPSNGTLSLGDLQGDPI